MDLTAGHVNTADVRFEVKLPNNLKVPITAGPGEPAMKATRLVAALCYIFKGKKLEAADTMFLASTDDESIHNQRWDKRQQFIQQWGERLVSTFGVCDAPNGGGRPRTVDRTPLQHIVQDIVHVADDGKPYSSFDEAVHSNPEHVAASGSKSVEYVAKVVKSMSPSRKRKIDIKPGRSNTIKIARMDICGQLLKLHEAGTLETVLKRVFWLDWCKVYVDPHGTYYLLTDEQAKEMGDTIESVHKPMKAGENGGIKILAVVSAVGGAVAIVFATGTTGLVSTYKVGCGKISCNMCDAVYITNGVLLLLYIFTALSTVSIHDVKSL